MHESTQWGDDQCDEDLQLLSIIAEEELDALYEEPDPLCVELAESREINNLTRGQL